MKNIISILITGGTSGIGKALCLGYAREGVHIAFSGRNQDRLVETMQLVLDKGANADATLVDVTDYDGMKSWIERIDREHPIDLVIANAGIATPGELPLHERTVATFDVNVTGVFNTIHPALELMKKRNHGQIAIVSSIAGYMGMPHSPSYSASKAALITYGQALRGRYGPHGIRVSVICPGVIHTPMTENFYRKVPGWKNTDYAVRKIMKGLERNKGLIAFPWSLHALTRWVSGLPYSWQESLVRLYSGRTRG